MKILYQISSKHEGAAAWTSIAPRILREEGAAAFWKGNTAAVVRVLPYMSLTFLTYGAFSRQPCSGRTPHAPTLPHRSRHRARAHRGVQGAHDLYGRT